jgi:hypothetical protein
MLYLSNAFSLGMLSDVDTAELCVKKVDLETARALAKEGFTSAVGHQGTASFLSRLLGLEVPYNRTTVKLGRGDKVLVLQLGLRLEEGRVLSESEVLDVYARGLAQFYLVTVGPCSG